jgi:hypothetical protein
MSRRPVRRDRAHTNNVVHLVSHASFMLSHSSCGVMARHAVFLRPDMYLYHAYSVMVVLTMVCDL